MSRMLSTGCMSKKAYATRAEATKRHPKQRAYLCPTCSRYHTRSKISRRQSS